MRLTNESAQVGNSALLIGEAIATELYDNLILSGMKSSQATAISESASFVMKESVGSLAIPDDEVLQATAPKIAEGALLGLVDQCALLKDSEERTPVIGVVFSSVFGSISTRTSNLSEANAAKVMSSVMSVGVGSLPAAGITGDSTTSAVGAAVSGAIKGSVANTSLADKVGIVAQNVSAGAVEGLANIDVATDQVGSLAGTIAATAIQSLIFTGLSDEQIIASKSVAMIMKGVTSSIASAGVREEEFAAVVGSVAGAAVAALANSAFSSVESKQNALGEIIRGVLTGADSLTLSDATLLGSVMASVAKESVNAILSAGLTSDDVGSAVGEVINSGITQLSSIDVTASTVIINISVQIIEGAMTATATLNNQGRISAAQTTSAVGAANDGARAALESLATAGTLSQAADIESFFANIGSSIESGLSYGGASSEVIANAQSTISLRGSAYDVARFDQATFAQ